MPEIIYEVLRKPIEQRLIDAACIYWEVERDYFMQKSKSNPPCIVTERRGIICFLIKEKTKMQLSEIAKLFNLTRQPVLRIVDQIESRKDVYRQISDSMKTILLIAEKLDATLIKTTITIVNNQLQSI